MAEDRVLEKTNRINLLFDFYGPLLTGKQQSIMALYYQDDFSLGEIAEDLEVSRQAVYEHVKRAEQAMEEYESKLQLAAKHERRAELADYLQKLLQQQGLDELPDIRAVLSKLQSID